MVWAPDSHRICFVFSFYTSLNSSICFQTEYSRTIHACTNLKSSFFHFLSLSLSPPFSQNSCVHFRFLLFFVEKGFVDFELPAGAFASFRVRLVEVKREKERDGEGERERSVDSFVLMICKYTNSKTAFQLSVFLSKTEFETGEFQLKLTSSLSFSPSPSLSFVFS